MKRLPLHTLVLLSVFLHSGSCAGGDGRCVPLFVRVGEKATVTCNITNPDQDGVYMYRRLDEKEEEVSYYYSDGTFIPEEPYRGRLETSEDFSDFSVTISTVSEHDGGVYWCKFNKRDVYTFSERTCLLVQSGSEQTCAGRSGWSIYLNVTDMLTFIILVLVVCSLCLQVKVCCDHGNHTPKQQPSNVEDVVTRVHTKKAPDNLEHESNQKHRLSFF